MSEPLSEAHYGIVNFGDAENPRIVLVQDADKPAPYLWKLPGGRRDPEDFSGTACVEREVIEEIGIRVLSGEIWWDKIIKHPHHRFVVHLLDKNGAEEDSLTKGDELRRFKVFDRKDLEMELGFTQMGQGGIVGKHAEAILEYLQKYCS